MNILIAGGSGFIGQLLVKGLSTDHHITLLGRHRDLIRSVHAARLFSISWDELYNVEADEFDAVINLSGSNIAHARWTPAVKEELVQSRVRTTECLIDWISSQKAASHLYIANGLGLYGSQETDDGRVSTEFSPIGFQNHQDFLTTLGICVDNVVHKAVLKGIPVTTTRFGVVLKKGKGYLGKLYPTYTCGLGSVLGNGGQMLSWIDSDDLVRAYRFLLRHPSLQGAINITSPNPCTQKDFAKVYSRALKRPLLLKMPKK